MNLKIKKAFTLSEVFVAMIVLAIVGTVCIANLKNRNDYSREYMYYSTYQNLVKVIDTIMDDFNSNYVYLDNQTVKFKSNANLCTAMREKLNHNFGEYNCLGKLNNGIQFLRATDDTNNPAYTSNLTAPAAIEKLSNKKAYTLIVDIDGEDAGKNTLFYDIMPFYITEDGKVIPEWGKVNNVRGYDGGNYDAGGNASLMNFDVVYTTGESNKLVILNGGRGVSFAQAACLSGYVNDSAYCNVGTAGAKVTKSATCDNSADCRLRLVKKLKWNR